MQKLQRGAERQRSLAEFGDSVFNEYEIANRDLIVEMESTNGQSDTENEADTSGYIDLTDHLDNIDEMHVTVGGESSSETGDHENWYICDDLQYGNYFDSSKVDDITVTGGSYLLYGIFCGEDINDAKEGLSDAGWTCTSDSNDCYKFEKDTTHIQIQIDSADDVVTSYEFWRDM